MVIRLVESRERARFTPALPAALHEGIAAVWGSLGVGNGPVRWMEQAEGRSSPLQYGPGRPGWRPERRGGVVSGGGWLIGDNRGILIAVEPAVFLDRDNTLIANGGDLGDAESVRLLDGAAEALSELREAGYRLVVVTNQGGVARGKFTEADVDAVHQRIAQLLDDEIHQPGLIERFYYCPYHPQGTVAEYRRDHPWRKPNPGMILQASRDMELDLEHSWVIGDQDRDIAAGRAAGCRTLLISPDRDEANAAGAVDSLAGAVKVILRNGESEPIPSAAASRPVLAPPPVREASPPPAAPESHDDASAEFDWDVDTVAPEPGSPPTDQPLAEVRRAILQLSDEVRSDRVRRSELTAPKMTAGITQLLVVSCAFFGLLQLGDPESFETFVKWILGAALLQLVTITLLLLDPRG